MKRYLLFTGDKYYPNGGMYDFRHDFDSLEEAKQYWEKTDRGDWAHIYDFEIRQIVWTNGDD